MASRRILTVFTLLLSLLWGLLGQIILPVASPLSASLDFYGIGGDTSDTCGYRRNGACIFCRDGFRLSPQGDCVKASRCIRFSSQGLCQECSPYLISRNGECLDGNCESKLLTAYGCQRCRAGFIRNIAGACVAEFCAVFYNGACAGCADGRMLLNGMCISQAPTVLIIEKISSNSSSKNSSSSSSTQVTNSSTTTITTINQPNSDPAPISSIFISGDGGILRTITVSRKGCIIIDSEGRCLQCEKEYALIGFSCRRKDSPCMGFSTVNGSCVLCSPNYMMREGNCIPTVSPKNCSSFQNGECVKCNDKFYLFKGSCVMEDPLCVVYDPISGSCTTCKSGYVLVATQCSVNIPTPPDANSSIFDEQNSSLTILILRNISIYYCQTADSNQQCLKCIDRFYLRQNTCLRVNHLCKEYNSEGACTSCFIGYALQGGKCLIDLTILPALNCVRVDSETGLCRQCDNRFYLHSKGFCIQVLPECKSFEASSGKCTSCYMGFFLTNGYCEIIPASLLVPFCRKYNPMDPRVCRQCVAGYYLESNRCLPVSLSCMEYDEFLGSCNSCLASFILSEGNCMQQSAVEVLSPYCNEYNKSGLCLKCKQSYRIINFVCIRG